MEKKKKGVRIEPTSDKMARKNLSKDVMKAEWENPRTLLFKRTAIMVHYINLTYFFLRQDLM